MITRRAFLSIAPTVPVFLSHSLQAVEARKDERILVVLQLDGGNDGINTVVPFKDEGYLKHRKELQIPSSQVIKLNKEVGLHPSMREMGGLWNQGHLAVVQGVGYPNPSRSHFESMAIWHTTRRQKEDRHGLGWLGRALDQKEHSGPSSLYVGNGEMPVALRGRRSIASALTRLEDFLLPETDRFRAMASGEGDDLTAFVKRHAIDAYSTAERMAARIQKQERDNRYPGNELGRHLQTISHLIKAETGARVFYARQGGYDTHARQEDTHRRLLNDLSGAIHGFVEDMKSAKLLDRMAILLFSEFGRTVKENGSAGTDHGTAAPVLAIGSGLKGGIIGKTPNLMDLDPKHGDLKAQFDFRQVYATILEEWLGLPSKNAMGKAMEKLALFQS